MLYKHLLNKHCLIDIFRSHNPVDDTHLDLLAAALALRDIHQQWPLTHQVPGRWRQYISRAGKYGAKPFQTEVEENWGSIGGYGRWYVGKNERKNEKVEKGVREEEK